MKKARIASISAEQDEWLRRASAASVAAARELVGDRGPIRSSAPIGSLGNSEWAWICSAAIWGWIATRSEQAASEGWNAEETVRRTGLTDPDVPWDTGGDRRNPAEARRRLARISTGRRPAGDWSKDELAQFLLTGFDLIKRAHNARDVVEERLEPINADVTARQLNGAAGNSRMTPEEQAALDRRQRLPLLRLPPWTTAPPSTFSAIRSMSRSTILSSAPPRRRWSFPALIWVLRLSVTNAIAKFRFSMVGAAAIAGAGQVYFPKRALF